MNEAKQMTTARAVGAAHTRLVHSCIVVRIGSKSVSSRSDRLASGRVLVFQGGAFWCSSRMNGKPSSPVLRGWAPAMGGLATRGWRRLIGQDHLAGKRS